MLFPPLILALHRHIGFGKTQQVTSCQYQRKNRQMKTETRVRDFKALHL